MENIAKKFVKKIIPIVTAATLIGSSLAFAKNKSLDEILALDQQPKIVSSEVSNQTSAKYIASEGINVDFNEGKITLDSGKDKPPFFGYHIPDEDFTFSPNGIKVIDFFENNFGNFLSEQELAEQFIGVAKGDMKLEDVVLFTGQPVTLKDMKEMFKEIKGFAKTEIGKDSFNHYINLNASGKAENLTTIVQDVVGEDNSKMQLIQGVKYGCEASASANFHFGARWPDSGTIADLIDNNFPEYSNLAALLPENIQNIKLRKLDADSDAGTSYSHKLTLSKFLNIETDNFLFGAREENSREEITGTRVYGMLNTSIKDLSVDWELGQESSEKTITKKSDLVFAGLKQNGFSALAGIETINSKTRTKEKVEGSRARIDLSGNNYTDFEKDADITTIDSEQKFIFGLAGQKKIYSILGVADISAFGNWTNYPDEKTNFGITLASRLVNAKVDDKGNYQGFLTLFGNKDNPIPEYFIETNELEINPLRNEIGKVGKRNLLRKLNGGFLDISRMDNKTTLGGIIASKGNSYLDIEASKEENTSGIYLDSAIKKFGISGSYKNFEDETMHGEEAGLGFSYFFNNGLAANFDVESKYDKPTEPEKIVLSVSKAF